MTVFKRLANESVIYGGSDLLSKLLVFFTFPIMASVLSPTSYGIIELVTTATGLLSIFVNCGINNAVQRYYWEFHDNFDYQVTIVSSALFLLIITSGMSIFSGFLVLPWIMTIIDQTDWPISVYGIAAAILLMAFSQITTFALDIIRLHFLPWKYLVLSLISRILTVIASLIAVVVWRMGADGLLEAQAFVVILITPLVLFTIKNELKLSKIRLKWIKEIALYGYPFIFAGLTYWLFGSVDRWMLASMSTIEDVGIFSVAFRFASLLTFVVSAFAQAWSPQAIKIKTDYPKSYRKIYGHILSILLLIMLLIGGGLSLFSGELVSSLMSSDYQASALPFSILCFGIIIQSTQQITAIGISIEKKTHIFMLLVSLATIVNFLLNLFLIPKYGATGAACSTAVAYVVLSGTYFYATQKIHHLEFVMKTLTVLIVLGIAILILSILLLESTINFEKILIKLIAIFVCGVIGIMVVRPGKFKYE